MREINFDMDGTFVNFYAEENWLNDLINEKTKPYRNAKPLINMRAFAKEINRLQSVGYKVNIISWTSKGGTVEYNERVRKAKINWLNRHLGSVNFDKVSIVEYGTPKQTLGKGILFDDEKPNRENWIGTAYDVNNIIETLNKLG